MDDATRWLVDRAQICDAVLRFALSMDTHDWPMLRDCLDDLVEVDYSAFRGEPPAIITAEDFVERRRSTLDALRMQHLSTNHLVEVQGDEALCRSCYLIHRLSPELPDGENTLDSAGHYLHRFLRTPAGWKITAITQTLLWMRGNPAVHGAHAQSRLPSGVRSMR